LGRWQRSRANRRRHGIDGALNQTLARRERDPLGSGPGQVTGTSCRTQEDRSGPLRDGPGGCRAALEQRTRALGRKLGGFACRLAGQIPQGVKNALE
jgi:hypothetical protein